MADRLRSIFSTVLPALLLYTLLYTLLCNHACSAAHFSMFSMKAPSKDPCYDPQRHPVRCIPNFINAAFGKPVVASSTCGLKMPTRICRLKYKLDLKKTVATGGAKEVCEICDQRFKAYQHPASLLTDLNNPGKQTCWVSQPKSGHAQTVVLTLSLGKKYELTYVSLQFCSELPESLAIYKSVDYGKSWSAYQYYSNDCIGSYNKTPNAVISKQNEQEALCSRMPASSVQRLAFATLTGRPSAFDFGNAPVLQDWVTATDIRVVLGTSSSSYPSHLKTNKQDDPRQNLADRQFFYSMSDVAVGGRCKCNGHASRCIVNVLGQLACQCKHQTSGRDCEKCKTFFMDKPWARATAKDVQECRPCNCNFHARRCRFNMHLYRLSGYKSGGICINCRHNTAGRNCHYCRQGYFRDLSKPMSHRRACRLCECHPIGSLGRNCNQTTGQCSCKPGVVGRSCNQCSVGFRQSPSPVAPCIRLPAPETRDIEQPQQDAVHVGVLGEDWSPDEIRYHLRIIEIIKNAGQPPIHVKTTSLRITSAEPYRCRCPKLEKGKEYLILGNDRGPEFLQDMVLDRKSAIYDWSKSINAKVHRLLAKEQNGACIALNRKRLK